MRCFVLLIFFVCFSVSAFAHEAGLTVDLAQDSVDITTGFDGARITLFGVKDDAGHVAVVIRGPKKDVLVRKKNSVFGIWMNSASVRYEDVPQFYDFALSDKEENLLDAETRKLYGIGLGALKFKPDDDALKPSEVEPFSKALVRNKQVEGLFPVEAQDIIFMNDVFFKTEFYIPANVPVGDYVVETFLIDGGNVLDKSETQVRVAQVGFSSNVYQIAHVHSLLYGLGIVFIAVLAGWLSNAVRQKNK